MGWRPLFDRLQQEHSGDVLHEGVPAWLWGGLIPWISKRVRARSGEVSGVLLRFLEQQLRAPMDWRYGTDHAWESFKESLYNDPELALEATNLLLVLSSEEYDSDQIAAELRGMLRISGSAWTVAEEGGQLRLERRVPQEVRERYTEVSATGRHGEHLRTAWAQMYGRDPNPSEAYRHAVSAVEAAGAPVISPTNRRATLGTMIADVRNKSEKWNVPLGSTPEQGRDVLLAMMQGVWHGQKDRHGTPDEERPMSVSQPEAEAALHTAITLVHLFVSGLITTDAPTSS